MGTKHQDENEAMEQASLDNVSVDNMHTVRAIYARWGAGLNPAEIASDLGLTLVEVQSTLHVRVGRCIICGWGRISDVRFQNGRLVCRTHQIA